MRPARGTPRSLALAVHPVVSTAHVIHHDQFVLCSVAATMAATKCWVGCSRIGNMCIGGTVRYLKNSAWQGPSKHLRDAEQAVTVATGVAWMC